MARRRKAELSELDEPAELNSVDESNEILEPAAGDDAAAGLSNESPESPQESPEGSPDEPPTATPSARPAYDPTDWLARIQAQNQVVIDAATELESAKVVARNRKKSYDAAAELLSDLIKQQKAEQDEWNRPLPLFDGNANGQTNGFAAPAHAVASSTENGSIPDDQLGDAWRFASIAELELPGKLAQKLEDDAGVKTIGQLEDLRGGAGLNSIKGIGPGKITIIEDAVINWLSVQRDAKALSVASASASANSNGLSGGGVAAGETLDAAVADVATRDEFDDLDI